MGSFKAGFVSFVGRPNVGKSTLMNALAGSKIAITSSKPQTTRKSIRGIVNLPEGQIVLVDLPGVHRPRTLLGERLNDLVTSSLSEVDVIAFCTPANEPIGIGDQRIVSELEKFPKAKKFAIVTKVELVSKDRLAKHLAEVAMLHDWTEIVPVSAVKGEQIELLSKLLIEQLPESPALYPKDMVTDESEADRICELVRESALELMEEELPHSLAVTLDEIVREPGSRPKIHLSLWVERDSQKGIVIGKAGSRLKEIGTVARREVEKLLGESVHLAIQVRVAPDWQRNPKQLGKLGF